MIDPAKSRPRLALPFTIVPDDEVVHLIAGEDVRYSIHIGAGARRLVSLLERCDGSKTLADLLLEAAESEREPTRELLNRMYGERILIDGAVEDAYVAGSYSSAAEGGGPLVKRLNHSGADATPLRIFCQDTLDYRAALEFNHRCRQSRGPWLWVTTGPLDRGYVSPVFLPDAGPCLECLLRHFQRLSPVSHLYSALIRHGQQDGKFSAVPFSQAGLTVLEQLVNWKVEQMSRDVPSPAVFRLHALELESMEVSVHRVFLDPLCPECSRAQVV